MEEKIRILMKEFWDNQSNYFIKVILPGIVAICLSIGTRIGRKEPVTVINIFISFVIGLGTVYFSGPIILKHFSPELSPVVIGITAITGKDLVEWFMYKFKVNALCDALLKHFLGSLTKKK